MKRFIMPGGRYSGRRYGMVDQAEYRKIISYDSDPHPLNLVYVIGQNERANFTVPDMMRELVGEITSFAINMRKIDVLTLVIYKPVLFNWLEPMAFAGRMIHTTIITDGSFGLDAPGLPTTDILLRVNNAIEMSYVIKFGNKPNVLYGVLVPVERIHWALGALKHGGRPDINIFVDLQTISPIGGASV